MRRVGPHCDICVIARQARILRHQARKDGCCPLATAVRAGRFGEQFRRGQQDARDFLSSLLVRLCAAEPSAERLREEEFGPRSVIDDCFFGSVFRQREQCVLCKATADVLHSSQRMVSLSLPGDGDYGLECLWASRFAAMRRGTCPLASGCKGGAVVQTFLEKEPPFLVIHLQRVGPGRTRVNCSVAFPRVLGRDVLRTGPYTLAGVVLHWGSTADAGHYTAVCRTSEADYHHLWVLMKFSIKFHCLYDFCEKY